jgi:hypothetical protein
MTWCRNLAIGYATMALITFVCIYRMARQDDADNIGNDRHAFGTIMSSVAIAAFWGVCWPLIVIALVWTSWASRDGKNPFL